MGQTLTYFRPKTTEKISFDQLAEDIAESRYAVALTGAGVSSESGIPTFRDPHDGLWKKYDPYIYATIWGFRQHPEKIWELIRDFLLESDPKPNRGHDSLFQLEKMGFLKSIITQNVDNLHQDAGSTCVIEFHGNLMTASCYRCKRPMSLSKSMLKDPEFLRTLPPKCGSCNGYFKPDAILFGECIPRRAQSQATSEANRCDLLLVVGTSASVSPASDLPYKAMKNGAKVIEINMETTGLTNRISDKIVIGSSSNLFRTVDALRRMHSGGSL